MQFKDISPASYTILFARLLDIARCQGRRTHLTHDSIEDCAAEFAEVMLLNRLKLLVATQKSVHFDAWLHRCACNHTANFIKHQSRSLHWEMQWRGTDDDTKSFLQIVSPAASPDTCVICEEITTRILQAAKLLRPHARQIFLRYYIDGDSLLDLAASGDCTPDAAGKVLKRARANILATLTRQGLTDADVLEYLAEAQRGAISM